MDKSTYLAIIIGVVAITCCVIIASIWVPAMADVAKVTAGSAISGILALFVKAPQQ